MRAPSPFFLLLLLSVSSLSAIACGGTSSNLGLGAGEDGGPGGSTLGDGGASASDGGGGSSASAGYAVHLHATQAPDSFTDGLSGETPLDQHFGVRSLTLLRDASDPAPFVVFDNGAGVVDAPLNDGDDTVVGSAAGTPPSATFTFARVGVAYYDFKVAGTLHASGQATAGDYHDVELLSDASYHGQALTKGYYSFTFEIGSTAYGTTTGQDLVTPVDLASGGLSLVASGNVATYVFPVSVTFDPAVPSTAKIVVGVNTYENFRWQDQPGDGYVTGVFDTTPTSYETVESFGANAFTLALQ